MPLPLSESPWKSALNLQCGRALILVTSPWLLKTPAVSVIALRQSVQLRASNSRAMLYLQPSRQSVPSFDAYKRNGRWPGRDREELWIETRGVCVPRILGSLEEP